MAIDFNTEPFFDDYDEDKKFYKILFRPGTAVQVRELTQLQTILQQQIKRHGDHMFKEGSMIIPGQISYDLDISYVILANDPTVDYRTVFSEVQGQLLVDSRGVVGRVITTSLATAENEFNTLLVKFIASGTTEQGEVVSTFEWDAPITLLEGSLTYAIRVADPDITLPAINEIPTGSSSVAHIGRGVYYVRDHFVLVSEQTIILDKYSNKPSYRIGLQFSEDIIYPEEDESLLDNALGSPNYAAPGAARYYIDLTLTKLALNSTADESFIDLLRLNNGRVIFKVDRTQYAEFEKTLARRTYDESGDYTLAPFGIQPREFRSNFREEWAPGVAFIQNDIISSPTAGGLSTNYWICTEGGISSLVATNGPNGTTPWDRNATFITDGTVRWEFATVPVFNGGVNVFAASNPQFQEFTQNDHIRLNGMLAYAIEPSKAYVRGYEIEKISTEYVPAIKSRDLPAGSDSLCEYFGLPPGFLPAINNSVSEEISQTIDMSMGSFINVNDVKYAPDLFKFRKVYLRDLPIGSLTLNGQGTALANELQGVIGTARVRGIHPNPADNSFKLFLFDIQMNANRSFDEVKSIGNNINQFRANAVLVDNKCILNDPDNFSSIYLLDDYAVRNITDIEYTAVQPFTATPAGGVITIVKPNNFQFDSVNRFGNYICVDNLTGDYVDLSGKLSISVDGALVVSGLTGIGPHTIYAAVIADYTFQSTNVPMTSLTIPSDEFKSFNTQQEARPANGRLYLDKSYVTRIISVTMSNGYTGTNFNTDITNRFTLERNSTETHQDVSYIRLVTGAPPPTGSVLVRYEYIQPVNDQPGKFFSVDSYVADGSNISYDNIPSQGGYELRDSLDFRPYADNGMSGELFGRLMPIYGSTAIIKYRHYLPRTDNISLTSTGNYVVAYGTPSKTPREPSIPNESMKLAKLEVEPYTFFARTSVEITRIENKRYTMRDIGKLERRVRDLEYYTSLNLLEADTKGLRIVDANGFDRFQNGFLVDSFDGQGIGNVTSAEWNVSIDAARKEMRPFFSQRQVELVENVTKQASNGYEIRGDIITLPISSEVELITQRRASESISVNPFDLFVFRGIAQLNPWSDTWFSTERRPDIVLNDEGQYNAVIAKAEEAGVLGTVWNAWQTIFSSTQSLGTRLENLEKWSRANTTIMNAQNNGGTFWRNRATFTTAELNAIGIFDGRLSGTSAANNAAGQRVLTIETDAVETQSQRSGTRTFVIDKVDSRVVDDRVVDTRLVPYIRPRGVLLNVFGMKPLTSINAFFDNINVNKYIETAEVIEISPVSGQLSQFDVVRNCGSDVSRPERTITQAAYGNSYIYVTNGSTLVKGPDVFGEIEAGDVMIINETRYGVANVQNDQEEIDGRFVDYITLTTPYTGPTASEISYQVEIDGNPIEEVEIAFSHGEVVRDSVTNTTGIVVGQESYRFSTGVRYFIFVMNIKQTGTGGNKWSTAGFLNGEFKNEAGQTPRVKFVRTHGKLTKTSYTGQYHGIFRIPNNPIDRFRTGTRELKLTDQETPNAAALTSAAAIYEANGLIEIKQRTIVATRTATLASERVESDVNTVITTTDRLVRDTGWFDPLAQTFLVQQDGGAFLTSVDIFFETIDEAVPVRIEVREVVNGYPGRAVLPFSRVEKRPGEIFTSPNGTVATTFKFDSPVYVQDSTEYALVILSDSAKYRVHVAETGAKDYRGNEISAQPYAGVFFKSQNASTWTADQMRDLQFVIKSAKFNTSQFEVELITPKLKMINLPFQPFEFRAGSNKVRVRHRNHGFRVGDKVRITTRQIIDSINGIPASQFFYSSTNPIEHQIILAEEDAYLIQVTTASQFDGREGGSFIYATEKYEYGTAMLDAAFTAVPDTSISFRLQAKNHAGQFNSYDLVNKENVSFNEPKVVEFTDAQINTDVKVIARMSSTNENVTPILDVSRLALTMVNNKVDNPRPMSVNDQEFDFLLLANTVDLTATSPIALIDAEENGSAGTRGKTLRIAASDTTNYNAFSQLRVGNTIRFRYTLNLADQGSRDYFVANKYEELVDGAVFLFVEFDTEDFSEVNIEYTTNVTSRKVDILWLQNYNSEISVEEGSVTSKYVTKKINFSRPSEMLRIMFGALIPFESDVEVYYKTGQSTDSDFIESRYYRARPTTPYVKSDVNFTDLMFDVEDLEPFNSVIIKIVLRSNNNAKPPRIRDFRAIACAA